MYCGKKRGKKRIEKGGLTTSFTLLAWAGVPLTEKRKYRGVNNAELQ